MNYPTQTDNPALASTYNGWTNYETWNVSLWIGHDEGLYNLARTCSDYFQFVDEMMAWGSKETFDGVSWTDPMLDVSELDEMIDELHD